VEEWIQIRAGQHRVHLCLEVVMKVRLAALLLPLIILAACDGTTEPQPLLPDDPAAEISDGMHGGPEGFYFLPPMVSAPAYYGTFDPGLSPVVEVCESPECEELHAMFSRTEGDGSEGVRVDEADEHYLVNWHTNTTGTVAGQTYRVRVLVGELVLGYADIQMAANGREVRNLTETGTIGLVDGRTLPVQFRIETGIAGAVVVSPAEATIDWGESQQFSATVYDLHGMSLEDPVIIWTSSAEDVAQVDATGLATAVEVGETTVTARVAPANGSATLTVTEPPYAGPLDAGEYYAPGIAGELRSVLIQRPDGSSGELTVEIIDGLAILEGDMIIATEEEFAGWAQATDSGDLMAKSVVINPGPYTDRWWGAVVPFTFADDWGDNARARRVIEDAMNVISAVSSVRFVPRTTERDFVNFRNSAGCSSWVGRWGGRQHINLNLNTNFGMPDCFGSNGYTVAHEIMHALGFLHEQSRWDRNDWVQINWNNIVSGSRIQFFRNPLSTDIGEYDFDSLMHYERFAFARVDATTGTFVGPTIQSLTGVTGFGQRDRLSVGDIDALVSTYGRATTVEIIRPEQSMVISRGPYSLRLEARADAPPGREIREYRWTSDITGDLGTGDDLAISQHALDFGPHVIKVEAIDFFEFGVSDSVDVLVVKASPPTVEIHSPAPDMYCTGEELTFSARVFDWAEEGLTLPDSHVSWRVVGFAPFAYGKSVTRSFDTEGTYTVRVVATDGLANSVEDEVTLAVEACEHAPPRVRIRFPTEDVAILHLLHEDGRYYWDFTDKQFQGRAWSEVDGFLHGDALVWTTDRTDMQDPLLGTGDHVSGRLWGSSIYKPYIVTHLVTLTATDSSGMSRTATRKITLVDIN
jgi:hypothetical protein